MAAKALPDLSTLAKVGRNALRSLAGGGNKLAEKTLSDFVVRSDQAVKEYDNEPSGNEYCSSPALSRLARDKKELFSNALNTIAAQGK